MPFVVPIETAQASYPDYEFIAALTPSEQKAAFHVVARDGGEHLCLKIINPDYEAERLDREIRALQTIDHQNVVHLREYTFTITSSGNRHYMIEEFIDGTDLKDQLVSGNPWPVERAAQFFAQVCDGLGTVHAARIVHRDLKPSNIRVRPRDVPVIIDFGVARHLSLPDLTRMSQGAALGTPAYFAPEQFTGTRDDIDHRTDLFAVGILLYQAVTGNHPFLRDNMTYQQLSDAVCTGNGHFEVANFTNLPDAWQLVLGRLLEKQRSRRPQNASQVSAILRRIGGA